MRPVHIHGLHERLIASQGVYWTVLVPTRYMTSVPFDWSSVLNDGVLLEANSGFGSGRLGYPGLSEHIGDDETPDSVGYVPLL